MFRIFYRWYLYLNVCTAVKELALIEYKICVYYIKLYLNKYYRHIFKKKTQRPLKTWINLNRSCLPHPLSHTVVSFRWTEHLFIFCIPSTYYSVLDLLNAQVTFVNIRGFKEPLCIELWLCISLCRHDPFLADAGGPEARAQVHCLGRELAGGSPAGPWVSLGTDRVPAVSTICSYEGCLTSSQGPGR